MNFLD